MEMRFRGIGVSPGVALAPCLVYRVSTFSVPRYAVTDVSQELKRFQHAIEATRSDLTRLYGTTHQGLGEEPAAIFKAHLLVLDDLALRDEVTARVAQEKQNVEYILQTLSEQYAEKMRRTPKPGFQERLADVLDVLERIQRHLLQEQPRPSLAEIETPCIVVAEELTPSDVAQLNPDKVLAVALDKGGPTSHVTILVRALGIPAVVGLGHACAHFVSGRETIVDGSKGEVVLDPSPETIEIFRQRQRMFLERKKQWRTESGAMETRTSDGVRIPLLANIELPREVDHCLEAGAEGIGLYRTEYLFLNRSDLPSEEEQYHAFSEVARRMHPRPVVLRTLDIGGDKLVSVVQNIREMNPQLGWRAVRFCLARPDIFKTQMRAMLRASVHGNVHVMFPMISSVEEIRAVHAIWEEVKDELRRQQIPFSNDIPLGSMIEIPSAVLLADALAKYCAFFSIGTNDLIQYSLAVDRGNEKIAHLYEPAHPAVLKMIYWTATAAAKAGISCSVCGEMAGDPLFTELLLGLGVTSLSMSSVALPAVRATVAAIRLEDARSWAQEVLSCETSAAVRQAIEAREAARADASKKLR